MDFFEAQDRARRKTKWLLLYFLVALAGIVVAVYALAIVILTLSAQRPGAVPVWNPELFLPVAGVTSLLIVGGSLFKTMQLSGGGATVAQDLGGRLVDPGTTDHHERVLLNVVQEMAIASGTPVPEVYVMDEELGINAFAAGTEPSNAVIGVTRGCIDRLSRAELQGVIAHEFSHILNGDMRLNMRLIGVVFGILIIMIIGRTILYSLRHMRFRSSGNSKNSGGGILAIVLIGVGLMVIGWVGVIFARLIQAAVSRQREFLADASAVQFTREPDGIAGALKKIGGLSEGSKVGSPKAVEASHMFFAHGGMFTWGFATHPPLEARIKAIQPHWAGGYEKSRLSDVTVGRKEGGGPAATASGFAGVVPALAAMDHVADSTRLRLDVGRRIREGLSERWVRASQNRDEAQALVFAMLLAEDDTLQASEVLELRKNVGDDAAEVAREWHDELAALHSSDKIALIDLCIPTLRRMSKPEYDRFVEITRWLIGADQKVDLFEYMLQHVIARHLATHFEKRGFPPIRHRRMSDLGAEANVLVSTMARAGREGREVVDSFQAVADEWGTSERWEPRLLEAERCGPDELDRSLREFEAASPLMKKQILRVCGLAAAHDGVLSSEEAELLRTVADAIGAGVPPFVMQLDETD